MMLQPLPPGGQKLQPPLHIALGLVVIVLQITVEVLDQHLQSLRIEFYFVCYRYKIHARVALYISLPPTVLANGRAEQC